MAITLNGDTGITTPTYNGSTTAEYLVPVTSFKNKLINGQFQIDQRNAGASVTASASTTYTLDRWCYSADAASKFTVQQSSTAPSGFTNSLLVTSSSAYSVGASEVFLIRQFIEGYNVSDFGFGASGASTICISFWVRSSLTGTFGGSIQNAAENRSYPFSYTISSANTWEQKSVTITGDTSGTWNKTNGTGIAVNFSIGSGSTKSGTAGAWVGSGITSVTGAVSVVGTNAATWYVAGVQLEKGSTATSFDYRPYGTEFDLCQRYYIKITGSSATICNGGWSNSTLASLYWAFPTTMRTTPTLSSTSSGFTLQNLGPGADGANATVGSGNNFTTYGVAVQASCGSSGASVGYPCWLTTNASSSYLAASAEL